MNRLPETALQTISECGNYLLSDLKGFQKFLLFLFYFTCLFVIFPLNIICEKCGLPSGVTPVSLHKAFIAKELENGKSIDNLKKRYGYTNKVAISNIKAAYDLRKLLF